VYEELFGPDSSSKSFAAELSVGLCLRIAGIFVNFFFNVMLPVHLSIILDNDQLETHLLYFTMYLLHSCTCFEHYMLIIRRLNFTDAASGIVNSVSGRPVHRLRENCSANEYVEECNKYSVKYSKCASRFSLSKIVNFVLSLGYFFKVTEFCAGIWTTRYERSSMNIFLSAALIYKHLKFKVIFHSGCRYKVHC